MDNSVTLTPEDIAIIKKIIIEEGGDWKSKELDGVKAKIKRHIRVFGDNCCCYCRRLFRGEFNLVIDIEHILPKATFKEFEFTPLNLSIACKRCNMEIKKHDVSFIECIEEGTDRIEEARKDPFNEKRYLFIHPNLETYKEHLHYKVEIYDDDIFIKYIPIEGKPKGPYTYKYFELEKLEEDKLNKSQGIADKEFSPLMTTEDIAELQKLLKEGD